VKYLIVVLVSVEKRIFFLKGSLNSSVQRIGCRQATGSRAATVCKNKRFFLFLK
jgi:hypothetical protein